MPLAKLSALAFTLVCNGTISTHGGTLQSTDEAVSFIINIDIGVRKWCLYSPTNFSGIQRCQSIHQIKSVSDSEIVLEDDIASDGTSIRAELDRFNGTFFQRVQAEDVVKSSLADCEKRPFAGFPKAQF